MTKEDVRVLKYDLSNLKKMKFEDFQAFQDKEYNFWFACKNNEITLTSENQHKTTKDIIEYFLFKRLQKCGVSREKVIEAIKQSGHSIFYEHGNKTKSRVYIPSYNIYLATGKNFYKIRFMAKVLTKLHMPFRFTLKDEKCSITIKS